ncbi:MAG: radical SAM protein [Candidatus Helarchaeota archaeon]
MEIILNPSCSNNCVFCTAGGHKAKESDIRKQEINVAKNLIDFKKKQIKKIEISGSDPIEYKKLIPLVVYIKKLGFEFVQLSTHGKKLSDKKFLEKLILAGIDRFRIPIYGSDSKIHDSVTRCKGSFNETMTGIENIVKEYPNIELQISCLIVKQNKNDLINIVNLIKQYGINDFYFSIPCVPNNDYSYYIPFKNLGKYVRKIYNYCIKKNININFMEIPYCVFGFFDDRINNFSKPPSLGKYCQPPKEFRSLKKDWPTYRVKKKLNICNRCKYKDFCDGFFINDIDKFGIGNLKPIKL